MQFPRIEGRSCSVQCALPAHVTKQKGVGKGIHRGVNGETMSTGKLYLAVATLNHKHNAHRESPLQVFKGHKVLWTLEDAYILCQDNNYLFLLFGDDIEKSISVITRL
jgi:hypothetical protein